MTTSLQLLVPMKERTSFSWNLKDGSCARTFTGHTHAVMHLKVLPHDMMITSSRDGTIKLWNILNGELINSFDFQSQVKYFYVHPVDDGYSVILGTQSGTVSILKLQFPKEGIEESFVLAKNATPGPVNDESSAAQVACCPSCHCCSCCKKCGVM
ncbi:hypothetical protein OS493_011180 [Desmophyllum pertusum]|uniref:Uncharacterized protein n=1 Tax=Desmophyllum pertusum TaxID=174260 RepID=A0A9X0CS22_9CNID|nr:hypothetical protein OS493_011180 [Desmophyllum pertusum]